MRPVRDIDNGLLIEGKLTRPKLAPKPGSDPKQS
jgi:hypothetical protein